MSEGHVSTHTLGQEAFVFGINLLTLFEQCLTLEPGIQNWWCLTAASL